MYVCVCVLKFYLKRLSYLVIKLFAPDTCASFTSPSGITTLNHESLYVPVKNGAIVISTCT